MNWQDLLISARHAVAVLTLIIGAFLAGSGRHAEYEQSIKSFFSEDDPAIVQFDKWASVFGYDNILFICYDDPDYLTSEGMERIESLTRKVQESRIDGILNVQSLANIPPLWMLDEALERLDQMPSLLRGPALNAAKRIAGATGGDKAGGLTVASVIKATPPDQQAAIAERVLNHPFFERMFTSRDGKTASMVVQIKPPGEYDARVVIPALRELVDEFSSENKLGAVSVVGPPALLGDGFLAIERDGQRLAGLGLILIGLVMLVAVRSVWWTLVPITAGYFTWLATEWLLVEFGLKLSLSGGPLIGQIIVLTMPAASHLALHFRDEMRSGLPRRQAARQSLSDVIRPILWCAVTGAIGYGALVSSSVEPVRQFGAILGSCTLIAALWTTAIAPFAMMPPGARERPGMVASTSFVSVWMRRITDMAIERPRLIVLSVLVIVLPLTLGIFRLSYESNYVYMFRPQTRIVRDYQFVENRLDGIGQISLVVPTVGHLDASMMSRLSRVSRELEELGSERVVKVLSVATAMDPEQRWSDKPVEQQNRLLASKLELITASPQASALKQFWSDSQNVTRLIVRIPESSPNRNKSETFDKAVAIVKSEFGVDSELTGLSLLMTQVARSVIDTQWATFAISSTAIFVMLLASFRKLGLALLAMLPTMLSVGFVLGLMGWLNFKLDLGTALVASVALGLSVDDTFHCLLQYHRLHGRPYRERLYESYKVTGPGVLLSSFAVSVGFLALATSEFVPFSRFGVMVAIATAGSSIGNILLLPACLSLRAKWQLDMNKRVKTP